MGQLGFFDADKRLQALSARGDPLEAIARLVPWLVATGGQVRPKNKGSKAWTPNYRG